MRPIAFVRPPTGDFVGCVVDPAPTPPLDAALAASQHTRYREALAAGGFAVRTVAPVAGHPDAPFVEDAAVVVGNRALLTRPGHVSRRGETASVADALSDVVIVERVGDGATIDGGDVLQIGGVVYVGRSARTNDAGIEALRSFAGGPVVAVDVSGVLHLKSAITALDDHTVLVHPGVMDERPFEHLTTIDVPGGDPEVANVVKLPDGRILVGSAASAGLVSVAGFEPLVVDVSEFGRAGGGLTCLSLRLREVYETETP